jgi:hypothetical protein
VLPVVRGAAHGITEDSVRIPELFEALLVPRLRVIGMVEGRKEPEGLGDDQRMGSRTDLEHFVEILFLCLLHSSSFLLDVTVPGRENGNASNGSVKSLRTPCHLSHPCQRAVLANSSLPAGQFLTGPVT